MTAYELKPPVPLPSFPVSEAKERRKKQLLEVWARRKIFYRRFYEKQQEKKI
jgi:hypothetical protein